MRINNAMCIKWSLIFIYKIKGLVLDKKIVGLLIKLGIPSAIPNGANSLSFISTMIQVQFGVFIGLGKPQIPLYSSVLRVWF